MFDWVFKIERWVRRMVSDKTKLAATAYVSPLLDGYAAGPPTIRPSQFTRRYILVTLTE